MNRPRLTAERRRALEMLASSPHGVNAGLLVFVHGFDQRVLTGLVKAGREQQTQSDPFELKRPPATLMFVRRQAPADKLSLIAMEKLS